MGSLLVSHSINPREGIVKKILSQSARVRIVVAAARLPLDG